MEGVGAWRHHYLVAVREVIQTNTTVITVYFLLILDFLLLQNTSIGFSVQQVQVSLPPLQIELLNSYFLLQIDYEHISGFLQIHI